MAKLEEIQIGVKVRGLIAGVADVVSGRRMGAAALEVVYRDEEAAFLGFVRHAPR